ncbi:MAG: ATP-binding protein [Candidatus Poribacteria bacterium]
MEFLSLISESKLKQVLKEGAENAGISLLLYDKFGELIMQYPPESQQASEAKISAQIDSDLIFSEPVMQRDQIIARLDATLSHDEEYIKNIARITKLRIEDLIAFNSELESLSIELIHNYDELDLLYTSSAMLAGISDIEQASSKIIENAINVIKADYGSVLLAEEDKEELYFAYTYGKLNLPERIKFGQGVCGLVALERNPMLIENLENLPAQNGEPLLFMPPLIACPMIVKGKLVGVITLTRESPGNVFTAMDLKLLDALASQAAVAFMNVKLFNDLLDSNQQLRDTLELLQKSQERLIEAQRLSAMGQLVASVAHDINNPLTSVIGYTELLLMDNKTDSQLGDRLEIIRKEAERAAGIVRNLNTFAKKCVREQELVNINYIIQELLRITGKKFEEKQIQIITHLDPSLPETIADPGQIQQVFMNLLMNAKEAVDDRGTIEIKTEVLDDRLSTKRNIRFSISDNGHGIPKDIQSRIFEPFFTTKDEVKGTGLGLSICHGIVKTHEGRIYVESEVGKGTTFFVELPIVRQYIKPKSKFPQNQSILPPKVTGEEILIIDDELFVQDLLKDILSGEGYSVDTASNGEEALRKLEQRQYDLLMVDIIMPKINGIEFYNRIRKESPDGELKDKVIFITGDTLRDETELFFEQNEVNCISKPFSQADLCKKVNEMLVSQRA